MTRRLLMCALSIAAAVVAVPRVGRAASSVAELSERVTALAGDLAAKRADKVALQRVHAEQTTAVAALKRRRSSWRRDRALRKALAASRATAEKLAALDADMRALRGARRQALRALLRALDGELRAGPSEAHRARLVAMRRRVARALAPRARKIVLPSERIDPLADADELSEQSTLLADTSRQLIREERELERRERRFARMARLQRASARADEADVFDDNRPRRTTSRQAGSTTDNGSRGGGADFGAGAPETDADDASPAGAGGAGEAEPGFGGDPVVVLVDVVDGGTLDALRQAERSDDPSVKARAAHRARQQVRVRRERLERQRKKIEARIRALRDAR